ncbi:hypothetical protein F511_30536 [Dorcoceras hygrometricum]|uniref:Uncharacterized protein n=1 Tax=Dorcoceras hygrometricum TaxID=472368 RepID=A0A2Z7CUB2_9LAMI|nr:hypothetical protein F511_30536 [Dorcoceras hygrometricum]
MHISRNCVTNYIHMSFTSSCLDGNCVGKPLDKFQISSALVKANSSSSFHFRATLLSACLSFLEEVPASFIIVRPSAESLVPGQNAVRSSCFIVPAPTCDSSQLLFQLPFAPADLSSSSEHDVVTDYIIIDGPLRYSSWFSFDVPADPSSSSSACSWFLSFQLIHFAPAG